MDNNVITIDNKNLTLKDDLEKTIDEGSDISIIGEHFSIYAYQALKDKLDDVNTFRFIFSVPSFLDEEAIKASERQFVLTPKKNEKFLYGTEYELSLKNELTQKQLSRECSNWIKKKAKFRTVKTTYTKLTETINIQDKCYYANVYAFDGGNLGISDSPNPYWQIERLDDKQRMKNAIDNFNQVWHRDDITEDVTDKVLKYVFSGYKENSPEFVYFFTLYHIFEEYLDNLNQDELPNVDTGYQQSKIWSMLYDFQKDAANGIIHKLEKYNGCILADSVGLGKTFTALAVMKYYQSRNKQILVLCPKKLNNNWATYKNNYINNPIKEDRLNYDIMFHTDLSRETGINANGLDLSKIEKGGYDLIVIDESHNFRNGSKITTTEDESTKLNRYAILMEEFIKKGVKTKVLMLSATPVNNKFIDLKNQLELAYEGQAYEFQEKLGVESSINHIFKDAQAVFNQWSETTPDKKDYDELMNRLNPDFFKIIEEVTIARSRSHIEKYYDINKIGAFPTHLDLINKAPDLTPDTTQVNYQQIYEILNNVKLTVYTPSAYIHPSKLDKYKKLYDPKDKGGLSFVGRQVGVQKLMLINLLKRLESSVDAFEVTLHNVLNNVEEALKQVTSFENNRNSNYRANQTVSDLTSQFDDDDLNDETIVSESKTMSIDLSDMDYISWRKTLEEDRENLSFLVSLIRDIQPEKDGKLIELKQVIENKINNPINNGNKKVIVFTAFADTAKYLYENIAPYFKEKCNLNTALVTGGDNKSNIKLSKAVSFEDILCHFSPISKEMGTLRSDEEIDILIATDCISEGQNLQDCDYCINYDIHWNPVRIIQRFGRIDRIGSKNKYVQLVNFWPNADLDEYLNLRETVNTKMAGVNITATSDVLDNPLASSKKTKELDYRAEQIKRLRQGQYTPIEEMDNTLCIQDLGLNDFKESLKEYIRNNGEAKFKNTPTGINAVINTTDKCPKGIVFVLKNVNNTMSKKTKNRLHPYYMVYIDKDGNTIDNYDNPKLILDKLNYLSKGHDQPIRDAYTKFNNKTKDGSDMSAVSSLLNDAIGSMLERKEVNDIDSLFSGSSTTTFNDKSFTGLDDFELITFFAVED